MALEVIKRELVKEIEGLEEKELTEALHFIEFLKEKKKGTTSIELIDHIKSMADPKITLSQVRKELSTIHGKLSDVVVSQREERG